MAKCAKCGKECTLVTDFIVPIGTGDNSSCSNKAVSSCCHADFIDYGYKHLEQDQTVDKIIYERKIGQVSLKMDYRGNCNIETDYSSLSIDEDCEDLIFLIKRAKAYYNRQKIV